MLLFDGQQLFLVADYCKMRKIESAVAKAIRLVKDSDLSDGNAFTNHFYLSRF